MFGISCSQPPDADVAIADGDTLHVGDIALSVMHTPGHSPGHVCFHLEEHHVLVGGDLLFRGSIGRTDFPGCDSDKMQASLKRVLELDDTTLVLPGHMEVTTIGEERATNPFLQGL